MLPLGGKARSAKGAHMTDNLLDFDQAALKAYCERVGEKSFRATQLFRWIHHRGVGRFDDMTDLARSLRTKLAGVAEVRPLSTITDKTSADGTRKWLFDVGQGNAVETVYISHSQSLRTGMPVVLVQCAVMKLLLWVAAIQSRATQPVVRRA